MILTFFNVLYHIENEDWYISQIMVGHYFYGDSKMKQKINNFYLINFSDIEVMVKSKFQRHFGNE